MFYYFLSLSLCFSDYQFIKCLHPTKITGGVPGCVSDVGKGFLLGGKGEGEMKGRKGREGGKEGKEAGNCTWTDN